MIIFLIAITNNFSGDLETRKGSGAGIEQVKNYSKMCQAFQHRDFQMLPSINYFCLKKKSPKPEVPGHKPTGKQNKTSKPKKTHLKQKNPKQKQKKTHHPKKPPKPTQNQNKTKPLHKIHQINRQFRLLFFFSFLLLEGQSI